MRTATGPISAILAIGLAAACSSPGVVAPVTVIGYTVTIKTAAPASAQVGSSLLVAFTVVEKKSDSSSMPASGKSFTVAITAGGGTVNAAASTTLTTASDGSASLTWVLGTLAGTQSIRGSASSDGSLDVSTIATAGPAARLAVTVQPSSFVLTGLAFTPQPAVQLEDASGNPVALGAVPITAAIATGGGTLGGTLTVSSDATGLATFTDLSLSGVAGMVTLRFAATLSGQTATDTSSAINVVVPWIANASLPTPRWGLGTGVVNGILYAVGGYNGGALGTVEAYDPATNSWRARAAMPTPRYGLAVGVVNGILYAVGGDTTDAESGFGVSVATVEAYDPTANSWTTKASLRTPRGDLAIGVVNGILYAVGGDGTGTVEAYNPTADSWATRASMPTPRGEFAIGVVNGILYAVGGDSAGSVVAYDPAANSWTTKAPMPASRSALAVGVVNGILYAVGGFNGRPLGTFAAYDAVTNSWTARGEKLTPRDELSVGVVNGVLYAVGGFVSPSALGTVESIAP